VKLSVLIPAHNEAASIGSTANNLFAELDRNGIEHEILVINDHSTDQTEVVLQDLAKSIPTFRYLNNSQANGLGLAVRKGLECFSGDAVAVYMADGSDDPNDLVRFFRTMQSNNTDCVFGTRFSKESKLVGYPLLKLILNRGGNGLIRLLFGLRYNDVTNAFKGYRRNVIDGCRPFLSPHFNLTVEIPLKAVVRGYSYAVIPIRWRNRKTGVSALKIQEMGSRYLYIVLNIWLEKMLTQKDYCRPDAVTAVPLPDPVRHGRD